ncbi:MAG: DCC1-like thiol-disulfide oxidoreductase family protein [Spongiibacteraceae bacterium]
MSERDILLVYDGECPVCTNYSKRLRITESAGNLVLVDAREGGAVMDEITALGLDIDRGLVLKVAAEVYYGAEVLHVLALISTRSTLFNRLNYLLFKSPKLASASYPFMRFCRGVLLRVLGINHIDNLAAEAKRLK